MKMMKIIEMTKNEDTDEHSKGASLKGSPGTK